MTFEDIFDELVQLCKQTFKQKEQQYHSAWKQAPIAWLLTKIDNKVQDLHDIETYDFDAQLENVVIDLIIYVAMYYHRKRI